MDETPARPAGRSASDDGSIRRTSVDLLRRAQDGDTEALDRLIQRYLPALRRWASGRLPRYARERLDTDDLVQETVLAVLPYVHSFEPRGDGALQAYMRKVLLNRIRREIRRAQRGPRRVTLGTDRPDPMESPLEEAIGKEAVARYEAALRRLRAVDREAIIARVEMHCSFEQLAEMLGKPSADAARMAASRALLQLAKEMDRGT